MISIVFSSILEFIIRVITVGVWSLFGRIGVMWRVSLVFIRCFVFRFRVGDSLHALFCFMFLDLIVRAHIDGFLIRAIIGFVGGLLFITCLGSFVRVTDGVTGGGGVNGFLEGLGFGGGVFGELFLMFLGDWLNQITKSSH